MLDALKFAFEILIVGALALPWVALVDRIFSNGCSFNLGALLLTVPRYARKPVALALVVAFGYLLGSATSRFSKDFFNDELWNPFPTENSIREAVYFDEFCSSENEVLAYIKWPKVVEHPEAPPGFCANEPHPPKISDGPITADQQKKLNEEKAHLKRRVKDARDYTQKHKPPYIKDLPKMDPTQKEPNVTVREYDHAVEEVFGLQEGTLLLEGLDKVDRLKQYFDQITVLRGAALNFFIVFVLCIFGSIGKLRAMLKRNLLLNLLTFAAPLSLIAWALYHSSKHWIAPSHIIYGDPPLAEIVWMMLGVIGFAAILKADTLFPYLRIGLVSGVIMMISFGGWWWTEVMYDTQIIHSLPELSDGDESPASLLSMTSPSATQANELEDTGGLKDLKASKGAQASRAGQASKPAQNPETLRPNGDSRSHP